MADNKTVKSCKSASLVDIGDDVFCLEFHTKMNAINGEIVDFMAQGVNPDLDLNFGDQGTLDRVRAMVGVLFMSPDFLFR